MIRDKTALMPIRGRTVAVAGDTPVAARVYALLQQAGVRVRRGARYDDVAVVVECVGGVSSAYEVAMGALAQGVACVTANTLLVAVHGRVLQNAAAGQQCGFYYGAALGVAQPLAGWLAGSAVQRVVLAAPAAANQIVQRMLARGEDSLQAMQALEVGGFDMQDSSGKHTLATALAVQAVCGIGMAVGQAVRKPLEQMDVAGMAAMRRFGLTPVYAATVERERVWAGIHAVAADSPLLAAGTHEVMVMDTAYGVQAMQREMVGEEATAHALVQDVMAALQARRIPAQPVCRWQQAPVAQWLVRVPHGQRAALLEQVSLVDEMTSGDGFWLAVVEAAEIPDGIWAVPLAGGYSEVRGGLRLVG